MSAYLHAPASPWPLHRFAEITLDKEERARVAEQVATCLRSEAFPPPRVRFGADIAPGYLDAPMLVLEDHRSIELMPQDKVQLYEYRSYGLARGGDFLLLSRPPLPAFERYFHQTLALDTPTVLQVDRGDLREPIALADACRRNDSALERLQEAAAAAGAFNVLPYITSGHSWLLAAKIAQRAKVPVRVCGPSPKLTRRVNNKLWFSRQVRDLFGTRALPPTFAVFGPAAAAAFMRRLARRHARIIVKLPSSAGSMGNLHFQATFIQRTSVGDLKALLLQQLEAVGWSGRYPVLVGVWETGALASPSVQMWISDEAGVVPVIEGLFGQTLTNEEHAFSGAVPLALPTGLQSSVLRQATMIGMLLQQLGYFGRVSLDALLVGDDLDRAELHWIECNGRWGGVSIPMTLAGRLGIEAATDNLVIVQRRIAGWVLPDFETSIRACAPLLYRPGAKEGVVFTEPTGPTERGIGFFTTATSPERCEALAARTVDLLVADASARGQQNDGAHAA